LNLKKPTAFVYKQVRIPARFQANVDISAVKEAFVHTI